jgi:hypothetical protein
LLWANSKAHTLAVLAASWSHDFKKSLRAC